MGNRMTPVAPLKKPPLAVRLSLMRISCHSVTCRYLEVYTLATCSHFVTNYCFAVSDKASKNLPI